MKIMKAKNLDISGVAEKLKDGQTLVYPTETCYGLGCDSSNEQAVNKIFKIKHRNRDNPVLVLVADKQMAKRYIKWNSKIGELAEKYWPGPLTIVTKAKENHDLVEPLVVSKEKTLAVRMTSNKISASLAKKMKKPLVSTSANISGNKPAYTLDKVKSYFSDKSDKPDMIIDAGKLKKTPPSTIVKVSGQSVNIIREGSIDVENE